MDKEKVFREFPTLETNRLILRQIRYTDEDVQALFRNVYDNEEVTKYDSSVSRYQPGGVLNSVATRIKTWEDMFNHKSCIVWGIALKTTNELIGFRSCYFLYMGIIYSECKLSQPYWKQGLMTEASSEIIKFLNSITMVVQIFTIVNKANIAAIALDKKLGFFETELRNMYFSNDVGAFEASFVNGLIETMKKPDELIFVLPKIVPQALSFYEKAYDARIKGNLQYSIYCNEQALLIQPNFSQAKNSLAWDFLNTGEPIKAIQLFSEIIHEHIGKSSSILGRAYAYSDIGEMDKAVLDYYSYLEIIQDDDTTLALFGHTLANLERYEEAIIAYEQALLINPHNNDAKQLKATALSKRR